VRGGSASWRPKSWSETRRSTQMHRRGKAACEAATGNGDDSVEGDVPDAINKCRAMQECHLRPVMMI
jgi:hypothetical protein